MVVVVAVVVVTFFVGGLVGRVVEMFRGTSTGTFYKGTWRLMFNTGQYRTVQDSTGVK